MSPDLLKTLDERANALRADIAASPDPRQVELDAIVAMRELYVARLGGRTTDVARLADAASAAGLSATSQTQSGVSRKSPETIAILDGVRDILEKHNRPMTNLELIRLLAERGVIVRGKNPGNSLSATLSNSSEFLSGGRLGWSLRSWPKQPLFFEPSKERANRLAAE